METLILNIIHSGYLLLPHNTLVHFLIDGSNHYSMNFRSTWAENHMHCSIQCGIIHITHEWITVCYEGRLCPHQMGGKKTKQHSFKMNVLILQNVFFFRGIYKIKNGGKMFIFNIRSVFHMIHMEITAPYTIYSLNIFCYSNIRATFNILFQDNIKAHRRSLYSCLHLKQ